MGETLNVFIAGSKALIEASSAANLSKEVIFSLNTLQTAWGITIVSRTYENFESAANHEKAGQQGEYDRFIENDANIFICIVDRRLGEITKQEIEKAKRRFENHEDIKLYLFMRQADGVENAEADALVNYYNANKQYFIEYSDEKELFYKCYREINEYLIAQMRGEDMGLAAMHANIMKGGDVEAKQLFYEPRRAMSENGFSEDYFVEEEGYGRLCSAAGMTPVTVVTGRPGTGKTRALYECLHRSDGALHDKNVLVLNHLDLKRTVRTPDGPMEIQYDMKLILETVIRSVNEGRREYYIVVDQVYDEVNSRVNSISTDLLKELFLAILGSRNQKIRLVMTSSLEDLEHMKSIIRKRDGVIHGVDDLVFAEQTLWKEITLSGMSDAMSRWFNERGIPARPRKLVGECIPGLVSYRENIIKSIFIGYNGRTPTDLMKFVKACMMISRYRYDSIPPVFLAVKLYRVMAGQRSVKSCLDELVNNNVISLFGREQALPWEAPSETKVEIDTLNDSDMSRTGLTVTYDDETFTACECEGDLFFSFNELIYDNLSVNNRLKIFDEIEEALCFCKAFSENARMTATSLRRMIARAPHGKLDTCNVAVLNALLRSDFFRTVIANRNDCATEFKDLVDIIVGRVDEPAWIESCLKMLGAQADAVTASELLRYANYHPEQLDYVLGLIDKMGVQCDEHPYLYRRYLQLGRETDFNVCLQAYAKMLARSMKSGLAVELLDCSRIVPLICAGATTVEDLRHLWHVITENNFEKRVVKQMALGVMRSKVELDESLDFVFDDVLHLNDTASRGQCMAIAYMMIEVAPDFESAHKILSYIDDDLLEKNPQLLSAAAKRAKNNESQALLAWLWHMQEEKRGQLAPIFFNALLKGVLRQYLDALLAVRFIKEPDDYTLNNMLSTLSELKNPVDKYMAIYDILRKAEYEKWYTDEVHTLGSVMGVLNRDVLPMSPFITAFEAQVRERNTDACSRSLHIVTMSIRRASTIEEAFKLFEKYYELCVKGNEQLEYVPLAPDVFNAMMTRVAYERDGLKKTEYGKRIHHLWKNNESKIVVDEDFVSCAIRAGIEGFELIADGQLNNRVWRRLIETRPVKLRTFNNLIKFIRLRGFTITWEIYQRMRQYNANDRNLKLVPDAQTFISLLDAAKKDDAALAIVKQELTDIISNPANGFISTKNLEDKLRSIPSCSDVLHLNRSVFLERYGFKHVTRLKSEDWRKVVDNLNDAASAYGFITPSMLVLALESISECKKQIKGGGVNKREQINEMWDRLYDTLCNFDRNGWLPPLDGQAWALLITISPVKDPNRNVFVSGIGSQRLRLESPWLDFESKLQAALARNPYIIERKTDIACKVFWKWEEAYRNAVVVETYPDTYWPTIGTHLKFLTVFLMSQRQNTSDIRIASDHFIKVVEFIKKEAILERATFEVYRRDKSLYSYDEIAKQVLANCTIEHRPSQDELVAHMNRLIKIAE